MLCATCSLWSSLELEHFTLATYFSTKFDFDINWLLYLVILILCRHPFDLGCDMPAWTVSPNLPPKRLTPNSTFNLDCNHDRLANTRIASQPFPRFHVQVRDKEGVTIYDGWNPCYVYLYIIDGSCKLSTKTWVWERSQLYAYIQRRRLNDLFMVLWRWSESNLFKFLFFI